MVGKIKMLGFSWEGLELAAIWVIGNCQAKPSSHDWSLVNNTALHTASSICAHLSVTVLLKSSRH